jgi:hypothetical protein
VLLPVLLVLALTASAMFFYNYNVTGSPFRMPYQVHEQAYSVAPLFLWENPKPEPFYRHEVIRRFQVEFALYQFLLQRQSLLRLALSAIWKTAGLWAFYVGPALTIPLFALPRVVRNRWMCFALLTCSLLLSALLWETWFQPHYAAPVTCLVFLLLVQAMRHCYFFRWRGRPVGPTLFHAIPAVSILLAGLSLNPGWRPPPDKWQLKRAGILQRLQQDERLHLVVVRYGPSHLPHHEWVYNGADIDRAKVVWAREMDDEENEKLLKYFRNRCAWLVEADAEHPTLTPYFHGPHMARSSPSP